WPACLWRAAHRWRGSAAPKVCLGFTRIAGELRRTVVRTLLAAPSAGGTRPDLRDGRALHCRDGGGGSAAGCLAAGATALLVPVRTGAGAAAGVALCHAPCRRADGR